MESSILSFLVFQYIPEFAHIHVHWVCLTILVMLSNYLILCYPLTLLSSVFSSISVFSNDLALCIRWPKYWSFSFSISPSNEHSGLISIRIYWFDLLAFQGTHNRFLQHHSLKASILWCSPFFMVQLSHQNLKDASRNLLKLINEFGKVADHKINT